mmetsp:Transcript_45466/g.131626  ORF Transcript_45466/g.131626 Transcript_45466/m.131626 type:complete len:82 (-) Transcript_45466:40-285(-)
MYQDMLLDVTVHVRDIFAAAILSGAVLHSDEVGSAAFEVYDLASERLEHVVNVSNLCSNIELLHGRDGIKHGPLLCEWTAS